MLRQLLVFSVFTLCSFGLFGQTLSLSPMEQDVTDDASEFELVAYSTLTNNSNDTITIGWKKEFVGLTAPNWTAAVCVGDQCYLASIDSLCFDLAPGESTALDIHTYPGEVEGTGTVTVRLTDKSNGAELLTGTYNFATTGAVDATDEEIASKAMKLYPNPAVNHFYLSDHPTATRITLYNLTGRVARSYQVMPGQRYSLDGLPNGLYLAAIQNDRGDLLRTLRLQKRRVGP